MFSLTQNCKFGSFKAVKKYLNSNVWFYFVNIKFMHMMSVAEMYSCKQMHWQINIICNENSAIMCFVDAQTI